MAVTKGAEWPALQSACSPLCCLVQGVQPEWHCSLVEVTDLTSGVTVRFPCWRWFARGRGDGMLERDLYPEGSPQALGQPMTQYKVQLKDRSKTSGQSQRCCSRCSSPCCGTPLYTFCYSHLKSLLL